MTPPEHGWGQVEEVERVVRAAGDPADPLPVEDGIAVIGRFLDQSEYVAMKAANTWVSGN